MYRGKEPSLYLFFIILLCSPTNISKMGSGDFAEAVGFSCPSGSSVILNHLPKRATCAAYTLAKCIILLAPGKWASVSVKHCQEGGGQALPVMTYLEMLFLKGVLFSGFSYIKG